MRSSDECRNALFLVICDRLGCVSVYSMIYGARVAFWNVGKGAKLITETSQMGVNAQNVKNIALGNYQVAILTADGDIKRVCVPLHLAVSDQNSPRLADLATLKELGFQFGSRTFLKFRISKKFARIPKGRQLLSRCL